MLRFLVFLACALLLLGTLASAAHAEPPAPLVPLASSEVPENDEPERLPLESPGLIAGGAVVTTAGLVAIPFGTVFAILAESHVQCEFGPCEQPNQTANRVGGVVLIGGGLAAIGGGITMMVLGSQADEEAVVVAASPSGISMGGRF